MWMLASNVLSRGPQMPRGALLQDSVHFFSSCLPPISLFLCFLVWFCFLFPADDPDIPVKQEHRKFLQEKVIFREASESSNALTLRFTDTCSISSQAPSRFISHKALPSNLGAGTSRGRKISNEASALASPHCLMPCHWHVPLCAHAFGTFVCI